MLNKTPPSTPSSGRNSKQKLMTPDIPLLKSILKTPNTPRNSSGVHFEPPRDLSGMYTGKSLSEALIMDQLTHNMTNDCSMIYQLST